MKRVVIGLVVLSGLSPALLVLAQSASSGNYQGKNMGTVPATVESSSPNYVLNGSVEAIVGEGLTSTNYQGGAGAPVPGSPLPPPPTPPIGGGSGGTPTIIAPTLRHRVWTYLPIGYLDGLRGEAGAPIFVNDSEAGVTYSGPYQWQKPRHPLGLGDNVLRVRARYGDQFSPMAESVMRRRLVGDVNDSQYVDDIDLSLFSRAWGRSVPAADFNEDGLVDDLDLSLLASHWNRRF